MLVFANLTYFVVGDLGRFNPITGDLIVTGRAKDTIVLSNGENVEPQPLEVRHCHCTRLGVVLVGLILLGSSGCFLTGFFSAHHAGGSSVRCCECAKLAGHP